MYKREENNEKEQSLGGQTKEKGYPRCFAPGETVRGVEERQPNNWKDLPATSNMRAGVHYCTMPSRPSIKARSCNICRLK